MPDRVTRCSLAPRLWRRAVWAAALLLTAGPALSAGEKTTAKTDAHPVIPGFERFHSGPKGEPARGGELLLGELSCVSCHRRDGAETALSRKAAPVLEAVGSRVKRAYLRAFLGNPSAAKPGTAMPDLFAGDPQKEAKVEALVHYLASTGTLRQERPQRKLIGAGKDIYHKIGCVACHGTRDDAGNAARTLPDSVPLGDLKAKYTLGSLHTFLANPLTARPAGRMPHLLTGQEAAAVANYLMQGAPGGASANMKYAYYEGAWQKLPDLDRLKPIATGPAADFDLGVARRSNNMAVRFEGYLRIEKAGTYTFHLTSDDGSKLWIDGKLVVANDGIHPPTTKSGKVKLAPGMHKLVAAIFNLGGGVELGVAIQGPGLGRQPAATLVFMTPEGDAKTAKGGAKDAENFPIKAELVAQGRALFASVGCANCHAMPGVKETKPATTLAKLTGKGGCLDTEAHKGVPHFRLSAPQRVALAAALKTPAAPPPPADVVRHTLTAFNCYACHERDKVGGLEEAFNKSFTTTQPEMGDEGRIPPTLTGVGAKMKTDYLRKVIDKGSDDRPYMHTRMPGFGAANVGHLVNLFASLDTIKPFPAVTFKVAPRQVKAAGRHMVGAQALGCIRCHTFAGNKAEGVQGIDMTLMTQRLNRDWFERYLLNPNSFRPGTRMPTSWPEGESLLTKVLDGKANTQIEAIWVYLSDGTKAALPPGVKKQFILLVPEKEPIIYRNFIAGAGPRAVGVGYPEHLSLAFDANDLRLALLWQGAFIDAKRHWTDRGVGFEPPAGENVLHLPAGVSVAVLAKPDEPWPTKPARTLPGYRFGGYRLGSDGRPTFLYRCADVSVEDRFEPQVGKDATTLRRSLVLSAKEPPANLWFRAAVADKIEAQGNGWYRVNNEYRLHVQSDGAPQLRRSGNQTELLVPLRFKDGSARIVEEYAW